MKWLCQVACSAQLAATMLKLGTIRSPARWMRGEDKSVDMAGCFPPSCLSHKMQELA